jgi:geranylgeranyl diphosphate synthase type I
MKNIENYQNRINMLLKEFLNKKLQKDKSISLYTQQLIENTIEYTLRGGKRIRPITAIFAYKCFKDDEKIIKASLSIELMQSYLLIHDDIMDKSELRRGKPTLHKIYERKYNKHIGSSMAILAGDLCSSYIYDAIIESDFNDREKVEAIKYIGWILERVIHGQTLDVLPNFKDLKEEDIWKIYELKTATYTMQGPIYFGCILANAPKETIKKLQDYTYYVGIAFQLQDDIIGIFGNVKETGKPNYSDAKEGKKTLIIVKTLEMCNKKEKDFILKKWGDENITDKEITQIREIIKRSGALDYCKNKLNELIEKGKSSIRYVELREEGKNFLLEMAEYIKNLP